MECFSIDESGYTGYDLLNTDQPFQGSTALSIPNDEARKLISHFFPRLKADELKFRSLARRSTYRKPPSPAPPVFARMIVGMRASRSDTARHPKAHDPSRTSNRCLAFGRYLYEVAEPYVG